MDGTIGNINFYLVAILDQGDQPTFSRFRRNMADG
jgi:hypothetical protein